MTASRINPQGRPSVTNHGAIERAAFELFEAQGFDATTMDQIADALGVGRRTLFRYFRSKNDIPWGQFDESLRNFRNQLAAQPEDRPLIEAIHRCIVSFNEFDAAAIPQHRIRMQLILTTPALQAHSALRYAAWRRVIAEHVAARTGSQPDDPTPRLIGHVSLALAVSSYETWLASPDRVLTDVLDEAMKSLTGFVAAAKPADPTT